MGQLNDFQTTVNEWQKTNFPDAEPWEPLVGMYEEIGELSHAFLKRHQGIRLDENHNENIKDAIGDILIYMCHFLMFQGLTLEECVQFAWEQVSQRDWNAHREAYDNE